MLKWLVIGIGDITTKRVIPALLEEKRSELWGIVTRDPAKAAPYGVRAFTDLDAAMAAAIKELNKRAKRARSFKMKNEKAK